MSLTTGSMDFQMRCTFAPGMRANASNGPVRSSETGKENEPDVHGRADYCVDSDHRYLFPRSDFDRGVVPDYTRSAFPGR